VGCVNPDGTLTTSATSILITVQKQPCVPDEIATATDLPIFRVRSALRNLSELQLVAAADGKYAITDAGRKRL
jgi:predicted transcriptional regulator